LSVGKSIELIIYGVKNPISTAESGSFLIEIKSPDLGYLYSSQDTGMKIKNTIPGVIKSAKVQPLNPQLGKDSDYEFEFEPSNSLPK
jgi:hypothetical protein